MKFILGHRDLKAQNCMQKLKGKYLYFCFLVMKEQMVYGVLWKCENVVLSNSLTRIKRKGGINVGTDFQ
jgi:hypothetical protein